MKQLFLDDERTPNDVTWINLGADPFIIVRNMAEFKKYINDNGIPDLISFDNDLGNNEPEGRDCVKWICDQVLDRNLKWNPNFKFAIHSKNTVAAEWIRNYLTSFVLHMNSNQED